MVMNNRGWLRVFEAVLAVLLIFGALLLVYRSQMTSQEEDVYISDWQIEILSRLADSDELRSATINENISEIYKFIDANIPPRLNYTLKICDITGSPGYCSLNSSLYTGREIFVQERIISGTLETYNPKRIRFFVWRI